MCVRFKSVSSLDPRGKRAPGGGFFFFSRVRAVERKDNWPEEFMPKTVGFATVAYTQ